MKPVQISGWNILASDAPVDTEKHGLLYLAGLRLAQGTMLIPAGISIGAVIYWLLRAL